MPIPPTNTTPETAFNLTGSFEDTIDLSGLANPQEVWFKFTLTGQFGFSIWAENISVAPFILYRPKFRYYLGIPSDPITDVLQIGGPSPTEFFTEESIKVPSTGTIYISVRNNLIGAAYVPNQPITIKFALNPNNALSAGSPLISNDGEGYPLTLISSDGTPSQLRSFIPHGESAAILANGISLWSEGSPDHTKMWLYDANLNAITNLTWSYRNLLRSSISSNRVDTFYIEGSSKITTVSQTGVVGPVEWTVPTEDTILFIVPSFLNNDIIYVKTDVGIGKFHKSTQILDEAYIPYELYDITEDFDYYYQSGYYGDEFLVLPDDSILALYSPTSINPDQRGKVIHYSSTGSVIREFQTDYEDPNRITYSNDYNSFWLWSYSEDFESQFVRFRISDGVRLNEFTLDTTTSGSGFTSEGEPTVLFGVPESCPFIITTTPLPRYGDPDEPPEPEPEEPGDSGIYFINPTKPERHDSYYDDVEKKIPNPTVRSALLGE